MPDYDVYCHLKLVLHFEAASEEEAKKMAGETLLADPGIPIEMLLATRIDGVVPRKAPDRAQNRARTARRRKT